MRQLIVGDIHGCYAELSDLLDLAGLSPQDEILALGDIVDRGPESPRVLDFFRSQPNARSLMGNHERKHVRSVAGELQPALSQIITRDQMGAGVKLALGVAQWMVIRKEAAGAGWWMPASAVALSLSLVAGLPLGGVGREWQSTVVLAILAGALTGLPMWWLLRRYRS